MFLVSLLAMLGVLLGAAVGTSHAASARLLGPIRAAGLGSGILAVFGQLLPEAAHDLGLLALVPFGLALLATNLLERALAAPRSSREPAADPGTSGTRTSLELGLIALGVHQLVEGIALGTLVQAPAQAEHAVPVFGRLGVVVGLVAHTVPIVAVLTLALRRTMSMGATLRRVGLLALVSAAGVLLSRLPVADALVQTAGGWIHAAVAGLLLHAVIHAASPLATRSASAPAVRGSWFKTSDAIGFVVGAVLVILGIAAAGALEETLASRSTWLVVALGVAVALIAHRAWPHAAHAGAQGF